MQDVGFDGINPTLGTDDNVINKYFTEYFPQAVSYSETCANPHSSNSTTKVSMFVWHRSTLHGTCQKEVVQSACSG